MTERERLQRKLWASFAPSRWHPFKRRAWFRSVIFHGPDGLNHWSSAQVDGAVVAEGLRPLADAVMADLTSQLHEEGLPERYSVAFDCVSDEAYGEYVAQKYAGELDD